MPFRWISSAYATLPTPSESYAGKTIIVTGGNRGIGFEIAKHFVRLEAKKVILGVRDISPGQAAGVLIESSLQRNGVVEVWDLDMENFSSVKDFVSRAEKELKSIDILVLNAAICRGWWSLAEGHETNVTINVLSTFLLALRFLPLLRSSASKFNILPIISFVGSDAYESASFPEKKYEDIFSALRTRSQSWMIERYSTTKLILLFAVRELALKLSSSSSSSSPTNKPQISLHVANPGMCSTTLTNQLSWFIRIFFIIPMGLFMNRTPEAGARNILWACREEGQGCHGEYIQDCKVEEPRGLVVGEDGKLLQERVFKELMVVLEEVEEGISGNI